VEQSPRRAPPCFSIRVRPTSLESWRTAACSPNRHCGESVLGDAGHKAAEKRSGGRLPPDLLELHNLYQLRRCPVFEPDVVFWLNFSWSPSRALSATLLTFSLMAPNALLAAAAESP